MLGKNSQTQPGSPLFAEFESTGRHPKIGRCQTAAINPSIAFMAFGFLIASLARTANGGMATANILNMPMMFLSGMFFPTSGLPSFIMVIVYLNPVTYLLEGLRLSVGVQDSTLMPRFWILIVPLLWILLSGLVTSFRLKWDVER